MAGAVVLFVALVALSAPMTLSEITFRAIADNPLPSCGDSDSGIDPLVAGKVTETVNGQAAVRADYCVSERILREWYCGEEGAKTVELACNPIAGQRMVCTQGRCG